MAAELKVDVDWSRENKDRDRAEKALAQRMNKLIKDFPGYAAIRKLTVAREKWTIDNGFMTPTLKLKRNVIVKQYHDAIAQMYKAHAL